MNKEKLEIILTCLGLLGILILVVYVATILNAQVEFLERKLDLTRNITETLWGAK